MEQEERMSEYSIKLTFEDYRDLMPVGEEILHTILEKYKSHGAISFIAIKPKEQVKE